MFEKPVNLGPSINSFKEENCFFVSSDGKTAYYSTDRFDNQHDIYTVLINDSIRPNNILSIEREILSSKNSEIILNNIQFETNSFTLINSSFSDIDELIVTNSIPLNKDAKKCSKIRVISIANIIAECITRLSNEESLSEMFL